MNLIYEEFGVFLGLTVIIGGGAAWLAGRALALTWRPWKQAVLFMAILSAVVRFFHYALFEHQLLSIDYYLVTFVVLLTSASLSYRFTRTNQMVNNYRWLYERTGPFSWREKTGGKAPLR